MASQSDSFIDLSDSFVTIIANRRNKRPNCLISKLLVSTKQYPVKVEDFYDFQHNFYYNFKTLKNIWVVVCCKIVFEI